MRLYRGIAVQTSAAVSVMEAIQREGLVIEGRLYSGLAVHDLKPLLEKRWRSPDLSMKLTRPEGELPVPRICAQRRDALYYASIPGLTVERSDGLDRDRSQARRRRIVF